MFSQILRDNLAQFLNLVPLFFVCLFYRPLWDAFEVHLEHKGSSSTAASIDWLQLPTSDDHLTSSNILLNRLWTTRQLLVSEDSQDDLSILSLQLS